MTIGKSEKYLNEAVGSCARAGQQKSVEPHNDAHARPVLGVGRGGPPGLHATLLTEEAVNGADCDRGRRTREQRITLFVDAHELVLGPIEDANKPVLVTICG